MSDTTTVKRYWKRVGWIAIENDAGKMVHYADTIESANSHSLDFKFNGRKYGDIYGKFECGILGLSTDTIRNLTTWNVAQAVKRRRRIQVFAGYEVDSLKNPIFDGYVLEALPTNPPEMWMNFKCLQYFDTGKPVYEDSSGKTKLSTVIAHIAELCGLKWSDENWKSKTLDKNREEEYLYFGTKPHLIGTFVDRFGVMCYEDKGNLYVNDKRPWLHDPEDAEPLSAEYGMLNIGNITMAGANITRRLNDSIGLCEWVDVTSRLVPCADHKYMVISKTHRGHFRGEEWFTELECIRHGAQI